MTWEQAMRYALRQARAIGRKHYVRAYRKEFTGEWRYGAYAVRYPMVHGREWP